MDTEDVAAGLAEIRRHINEFGAYGDEVAKLTDEALLKQYDSVKNNYEKLHIFRMFGDITGEDKAVQKFINETYHIENDYLFQLNPLKYEIIPGYIIKECDKSLTDLRSKVPPAQPLIGSPT